MHKHSNKLFNTLFASLLIGVPAIPLAVSAQTRPTPSVCPSLYYEEPWNSRAIVPTECPPNAVTEQLIEEGRLSRQTGTGTATETAQPPLPEARSQVVATVTPTDGTVDVRLKNNTNALVRYQAIGYTDYLPLEGPEEIIVQDVPPPTTITFARQDDGFLEIQPVAFDEQGLLEVSLDEDATPLDPNQGVIRIQEDGQVLLN